MTTPFGMPTFVKVGKKKTPKQLGAPGTVKPPTESGGSPTLDPQGWITTISDSATTDATIATGVAGDMIIVVGYESSGGAFVGTPTGFTEIVNVTEFNNGLAVWAKIADGTEGNSVNVNNDSANTVINTNRIIANGATLSIAGIVDSTAGSPDGLNPSPVTLVDSEYVVIVPLCYENVEIDTIPTGYEYGVTEDTGAFGSDHHGIVTQRLVTGPGTEDPTTYNGTLGVSPVALAATVAIPIDPAGATVAPADHTHVEADITDLPGHAHTESDISDIGTHTHDTSEIGGPYPAKAYVEPFLDQARLGTLTSVSVTVNSATKDAGNPLFPTSAESTGAWDRDKNYVSVIKNDAGWHMFYTGFDTSATARTGYASSTDGETWTKPNLGLVTYSGNTNNNILRAGYCGFVVYDEVSTKWIQVREENTGNIYLYTQDTPTEAPTLVKTLVAAATNGEGKSLVRRPSDGRWCLYYTSGHAAQDRSLYLIISDTQDLTGTWTEYGIILDAPDQDNQYYGMNVFRKGDYLYAVVERYNKTNEQIDVDLFRSYNGIDFTSVDASWLALGASTAWDDEMITRPYLVEVVDSWHWYYCGFPADHATFPRDSRVGRATIDRNRVGSIGTTGSFLTDYINVAAGAELTIDTDASGGTLDIEVQDSDGNALTGFATADFDQVSSDVKDFVPTWGGLRLPSGVVRLKFVLSSATLYQFEISDAQPSEALSGGGVSDHGALTGLSDDDHTQYLLAAGTRAATYLEVSGLTGATGSSPRFVGGTTTGAPASGTFALGDYVVTEDGNIYVCTTAGTPGTWTAVGAGAATDSDAIHDNVAGEISALTLVTAASGDHVLIEDASDSNNKKRVAASDFLGGGSSAFSGVRVRKSSNQSIAQTTLVIVSWDTEDFDTDTYHDTVTNNSRLTAPADGYYLIGASILWNGGTTGDVVLGFLKNGTDYLASQTLTTDTLQGRNAFSTLAQLTSGDYVECEVYTSQSSRSILADARSNFWMTDQH